jgi:hypothetical protein
MLLADFQVSALNPSVIGPPPAGVFRANGLHYFARTTGQLGVAPSTPSATNATGQLQLPGSAANVGTEQIVRVRCAGFNGNGSAATIALYVNTGTITSPTYTAIAGTGSHTNFGVDWSIEAVLCSSSFNAASGLISTLSGQYSAILNGAYQNTNGTTPWVVLDNTVSLTTVGSGTMPLSQPAVTSGLVVGATVANINLGAVTLTQFQIFAE